MAELCNTWKVKSFCTTSGVTNHLSNMSAVKRNFVEGKSSTVDVEKKSLLPEAYSNATFTVKLPKKHFQEVSIDHFFEQL